MKAPEWLTTEAVLEWGGETTDRRRRYREYCQEAIGQGMPASPWDNLIGQTVFGRRRFCGAIGGRFKEDRSGQEEAGPRPPWEQVVKWVERIRQEKWKQFRDRHGEAGRDLALYLGRTVCGLSLVELSRRVQIQSVSAATAVRRFAEKAKHDRKIGALLQRAIRQLHNE